MSETKLTPRAVLEGMLKVWDYDPDRWTQGQRARGETVLPHPFSDPHDPTATSWCVVGAALRGSAWAEPMDYTRIVEEALSLCARELRHIFHERFGVRVRDYVPINILNDCRDTTFDDVLLATKRALDATYDRPQKPAWRVGLLRRPR